LTTQIQQLRKERAGFVEKANAITKKCGEEKRARTEEEQREWDGLWADHDRLKAQEEDLIKVRDAQQDLAYSDQPEQQGAAGRRAAAEAAGAGDGGAGPERRAGGAPETPEQIEQREEERQNSFLAYMAYGPSSLTPEARANLTFSKVDERDAKASVPSELRALVVGTASAGGVTVPQNTDTRVIKALQRFGGMRRAGRLMRTATGAGLTMPTYDDTQNEGELLGEAVAATEQDIAFDSKALGAHKYSTKLMKVSRELLQDSPADVVGIIADAFGERIGRITNRHYTTGDGSNKPQGLAPIIAIGKTGSSQTGVTNAEVLDLVHSVDPAYRVQLDDRFVGFMFADSTLRILRGITGTEGQPLYSVSFREGEPDLINGFPFIVNQDVAAMGASNRSMLFGDFSHFVIRDSRDLVILRLDERFAEADVVAWVGFMRTDSEYLLANAASLNGPIKAFQNAA